MRVVFWHAFVRLWDDGTLGTPVVVGETEERLADDPAARKIVDRTRRGTGHLRIGYSGPSHVLVLIKLESRIKEEQEKQQQQAKQ